MTHVLKEKRDEAAPRSRDAAQQPRARRGPASLRALVALGPLPNFAAKRVGAANGIALNAADLELVAACKSPHAGDAERTCEWRPPVESKLDAEKTLQWEPPVEPDAGVEPGAERRDWKPLADALEPRSEAEPTLVWAPPPGDDAAVRGREHAPVRRREDTPAREAPSHAAEPEPIEELAGIPRRRGWIAAAVASAVLLVAGAHATRAQQSDRTQSQPVATGDGGKAHDASRIVDTPDGRPATSAEDSAGASNAAADEDIVIVDGDTETADSDEAAKERRRAAWRRRRARDAEQAEQAEALVETAKRDLRRGRRNDAIVSLEQALELQPTSAEAHASLSNAYFDRGDFELAVAHAEEAVKSEFDEAEHHLVLGDAYYRTGRRGEAAQQWRTAADLGSQRATKRLAKLEDD